MQSSRGKGGASFPLQLLLLFSSMLSPLWGAGVIGMMVYKGIHFPYPDHAFGLEIAAPILFIIVHHIAVKLGKRGNLTESMPVLLISLVLLVISTFGAFYFMWLQTYVTRFDFGLSLSLLVVNSLALIFCVIGVQNTAGGTSNAAAPLNASGGVLQTNAMQAEISPPPPGSEAQPSNNVTSANS